MSEEGAGVESRGAVASAEVALDPPRLVLLFRSGSATWFAAALGLAVPGASGCPEVAVGRPASRGGETVVELGWSHGRPSGSFERFAGRLQIRPGGPGTLLRIEGVAYGCTGAGDEQVLARVLQWVARAAEGAYSPG